MGTTYQPQNVAPYDDRRHPTMSGHGSALTEADRKRTALSEARAALVVGRPVFPTEAEYAAAGITHRGYLRAAIAAAAARSAAEAAPPPDSAQPASRPSARPKAARAVTPHGDMGLSPRDAAMATHSLVIPECISPRGGSLVDFTAQLTCFFWFESPQTYEQAEKMDETPMYRRVPPLRPNAIASPAFKAWVQQILSTTQVTQNVVLLALLYIYRLKMANLTVKGQAGSECRLLTVALMLGNKFLDDNTYTNKTWSDVSKISVTDIHFMEVEFLSNMRYSLLVSKDEWEKWLIKLRNFWEYCERSMLSGASSPGLIPSPSSRVPPLTTPSTGNLRLTPYSQSNSTRATSATYMPPRNPGNPTLSGGPGWDEAFAQSAVPVSPLAVKRELNNYGKRRLSEDDLTEPPPKKMSRQGPPLGSLPLPRERTGISAASMPEPIRPMAPQLTLNTTPIPDAVASQAPVLQAQAAANPSPYAGASYAPQSQSALSLPPLVPGVRAMATVYPPTTTAYPTPTTIGAPAIATFAPQLNLPTTSGQGISPIPFPTLTPSSSSLQPLRALSAASTATLASFTPQASSFGTPTQRTSPANAGTHATYTTSSPLTETYHPMAAAHTPGPYSPVFYLQQRASPYRPIRNVNTLLVPPPSFSLDGYHISGHQQPVLTPTQMHYHPLGGPRHELRTGIVPEFRAPQYRDMARHGQPDRILPSMPAQAAHLVPSRQHLQPSYQG